MKIVLFFITMMSVYTLTKTDTPLKVELYVNDKHGSSYTVYESRSVNLTCTVSGANSPRVKWHKDRINIKSEDFNSSGEVSKAFSSHILIPEVTCEDGGNYICQAGNDVMQNEKVLALDVIFRLSAIHELDIQLTRTSPPPGSRAFVLAKGHGSWMLATPGVGSPKLVDMSGFDSHFTVSQHEHLEFSFNVTSNPESTIARWSLDSMNTSLTTLTDAFNWTRALSGRIQTFILHHYNITNQQLGLYQIVVVNGLRNLVFNYKVSFYHANGGETTTTYNQPIIRGDNTTRASTETGDMVTAVERLVIYGVGSFATAIVLVVIFAAILACPCLRRCHEHLPCSKSRDGNPRIWVTMPLNECVYNTINDDEPVFGTGSGNDLPEVEFNHLTTSTAYNTLNKKLNNIHIQIQDYHDTTTV